MILLLFILNIWYFGKFHLSLLTKIVKNKEAEEYAKNIKEADRRRAVDQENAKQRELR